MTWTYTTDGTSVTLRWNGEDLITRSAEGDRIVRDLSGIPTDPNLRDMAFQAIQDTENNYKSKSATEKVALGGLEQFEEV